MSLPSAYGPATLVVISKHGMVVRVSDGTFLGRIRMPPPPEANPKKDGAEEKDKGDAAYSSTYNSWTTDRDILYAQHHGGWIFAMRLALDGDGLKQDMVWRSEQEGDARDPNLIYQSGRLFCTAGGYGAFDAVTGKKLFPARSPDGYSTGLGAGDGKLVLRSKGYAIVNLSDVKALRRGVIQEPNPVGEVLDRHIAAWGRAMYGGGWTGITCWGNRIFIRSYDYLYCVGDPSKPFVPPEVVMKQ